MVKEGYQSLGNYGRFYQENKNVGELSLTKMAVVDKKNNYFKSFFHSVLKLYRGYEYSEDGKYIIITKSGNKYCRDCVNKKRIFVNKSGHLISEFMRRIEECPTCRDRFMEVLDNIGNDKDELYFYFIENGETE